MEMSTWWRVATNMMVDLMPLDEAELAKVAGEISASGVTAVAISSIFSPLTDFCGKRPAYPAQ